MTRLTGAALILAPLLALAGCAQAVPGSAQANRAAAEEWTSRAYAQGIQAFQTYFRNLGDERAKVYNYLTYGDVKRTNEFESSKWGSPPATVVVKRPGSSEDAVTFLHTPNSDVDLVKLDTRHAQLAPTPWVSTPTVSLKDGFDPFTLLTSWVAIKLDGAITQTKLDAPDDQPRTVRVTPEGGFELHSGITLDAMLEAGIASVPQELRDRITADMRATVLPVRMDFGPDWRFRSFEVLADVPGDPQLRIQVGYEVAGTSAKEDIPASPPPAEVTAITDKAAVSKFYDDLGREPN